MEWTCARMPRYRIGCTGWGYNDWYGVLFPRSTDPNEALPRYARAFGVVEVESTYYAVPKKELTARWAASVPDGFEFSLKFPSDISHKAQLEEVDDAVADFLAAIEPLREAGKLGPLLLQLPPSFRRDKEREERLHEFLARWPRGRRLAIELRHESWWAPETYRAFEAAGVALAWATTEHGVTPAVSTAEHGYLRLVGDRVLTKYDRQQRNYEDDMRDWRARLEGEDGSTREWYVFVNNHYEGYAPSSAARLADILGAPRPDLGAAMRGEKQRSLF